MTDNETIIRNLHHVKSQIESAAQACNRDPQDILLLAVSKTKPVSDIMLAYQSGQRHFGENYVQEGVEKIHALRDISDILWHFIGPLQSNKSKLVAENFDWMHSLDRLKIAKRLSDQRPKAFSPLKVCIQINIDDDANKSGVMPEDAQELCDAVNKLPGLELRGLMTIPQAQKDVQAQKESLERMHILFKQLKSRYPQMDTLSMGMSDDLDLAISQGSTIVRIGTAIFGKRE